MKTKYRIVIKDSEGKIIPNAQIHFIKNSYIPEEKDGFMQVDLDNRIKENILFFSGDIATPNPLICNYQGYTEVLEKGE